MEEALLQGHISGDGPFTKRCERLLESSFGAARVLLTASCTHALEIAALLLRPEPGDEVIVPSFTFVSTANAFALHGATPVFVDVREDTLNLDESLLEAKLGPRTRAVVPVHYAGIGCEMDRILALARGRGVRVVEDAAHGLFGRHAGRWLGTFGDLATFSFHETKNVTCGEGGALVVNDPALVERAEILREKGTDRSRFFRGQVDKYTWADTGSSYVLSDLLAAFLWGQLEERERIQARRRALFERYAAGLADWAREQGVRLPCIPGNAEPAWHLFYLLLPDMGTRQRFLAWLSDAEILAVFHYLPLHDSPMGRRFGYRRGDCPVSESVSERLARLPLFFDLADLDQERIIDRIRDFRT
jgi:dTDP-4-amino-4,6-dideoxygalactose transaminase